MDMEQATTATKTDIEAEFPGWSAEGLRAQLREAHDGAAGMQR